MDSSLDGHGHAHAHTMASNVTLNRVSALSSDSSLQLSQLLTPASTSPAPSSPMSPALSIKSHSRLPSGSTLASSPPVRASMDSYMSKRPLTQLKEDPEERDVEMVGLTHQPTQSSSIYEEPPVYRHESADSAEQPNDYDWEQPHFDLPGRVSVPKRRRADRPTPSMISTKIAQRFPSISRRFRSASDKRTISLGDSSPDVSRSRSRANSMRSVLTKESIDIMDARDHSHLATPAPSFIEEEPIDAYAFPEFSDDLLPNQAELGDGAEQTQSLTRTPLLPPVLAVRPESMEPVQSPLHSPKVVETPTSPPSPSGSAFYAGLPSPPLSTRPSVASFHHRAIVPSSEIPVMVLAEPQDEWTVKLGHANFGIKPEPYLPQESTIQTCRKLKADWEEAEHQFGKHLARTRAVYSSTSKVAQLTEEKWSAINALWKSNHEQVLAKIRETDLPGNSAALSRQSSLHEPVPVTKIPSHLVGDKFPGFGDRGIVGPMEVVKPLAQHTERSQHHRTPSRKRAFLKFIQDLLPGALVKSQA